MRRGFDRKPRMAMLRACAVAGAIACASAPAASADSGQVGSWGALQQYPVVPVSMGVMPDGKIVAWDQANQPPNFGSVPNNGAAMILDPATGAITRSANVAPRQTFCSLIASLPDGRIAIIGGGTDWTNNDVPDVQIFDGDSKTFSVAGLMNRARWYAGGTLDRDGNPIVAGGSDNGIERVDQLTGASTMLDSTFPANWYPDLIRRPGGDFLIEDVGDNAVQGPGRYLLSGNNLSSFPNQSLLKTRRRGVRTMIGPYTMFYNSGGSSKESLIIDASSGTPSFTQAASSNFHHMTGQALTLPTGDVLAVGGNSSASDTKGTPVMTPELYSPASNTWTSMADAARRRTYHSVAALMPDGRVWSAGSSFDDVQEPNGQFFSPPYLFRKDGSSQLAPRPTATDAPASVAAGQSFSVATGNPSAIAYASFIRLAATTHQVNAGQAFVKLGVTPAAGRVSMTAPSVDEAPPGYYMVFLVNSAGVPSIAPVVRLDKTAGETPQPRVTQSSQSGISTRAWNAFDGDPAQGSGAKFSQTLTEREPFWQVDLGRTRDIDRLDVRLRSDCCTDRDLWVFASDTPFASTTVQGLRDQPGVVEYRMQTPSGSVGNAPINTSARYLRIQDPGTSTQLTLAEVELVQNQDPTVALTSPADGASFKAPASISYAATASDPDGQVAKVEFYRGANLVGADTSSPFTASESGVGAGTYQVKARATDNGGAVVDSSTRTVSVANNQPPSVNVTSPSAGATFTAPASYTFSANASDSDGNVTKVEFFRGSTLVGTDTNSPYSISESGIGAGGYTLTAKATDSDGAATTSGAVNITVNAPPATGPVAAYAFDEGAGSSLADKSGNGHTGAISGAAWAPAGRSGQALSFDGVDDQVTIADSSQLDMADAFTIESWIKPRTLEGWRMAVLKEAPPSTLSYGLYASSDDARRPSAWTTGGAAFGPNGTSLGSWSHLATAYDHGTLRLYVNGVLAGTQTGVPAPQASAGALRIGGNSVWSFETFDGLIDDVRVYDRALSTAEIAADRDTPVAPPPPPPSGPTPELELKFDEGSGTVALDTSGNGHDGTLSGAGWSGAGYRNGAIDLNGSGAVTVADHADLDLSSSMTLEAYVRPRSAKDWQTVVMKEAPPSTESYALYATRNQPNANAWVGPNAIHPQGNTPINTWTHLAFTLEGGTGRFYRDGVLVSVTPGMGSADPTNGPLRIGGNSIWADEGFDGLIDEVRVWSVALTGEEIAARVPGAAPSPRTAPSKPACLVKKSKRHQFKPGKCKKRKRG